MKLLKKALLAVLPMTLAMSFTAMAGQWHEDMNGWWYEENDGSYYTNGWYWLDGNNDGQAECYYFNQAGYMVDDLGSVDGYEIDENGAWTVNGKVQRQTVAVQQPEADGSAGMNADAVEVYRKSVEKNNALDSLDTDVKYDIVMTIDGKQISAPMKLNMKMKGVTTGNLQFIMDGSMNMLGIDIPVTMFYTDGYYYMNMFGEKAKMAMPLDEAVAEAGKLSSAEVDLSSMKDLQIRQDGENTVISYTMDTAALNLLMESVMDDMSQLTLGVDANYNFRSAGGEMVINKDGYYTSQTISMDFDMTIDGDTTNAKMIMYMKINNPGQPVNFTLPSTEGYVTAE